jgi:hypothetical protein
VVRQPRLDRWGILDGRVNPAEIVVGEEQSQRSFVVLPLFRVSIRQAGEPTNHHSHRPIGSLDVGRADRVLVGIANPRGSNYVNNSGRRIAALVFFGRLPINLDQRGVVDPMAEHGTDCRAVRLISIRRELETSIRRPPKLLRKLLGIFGASLTKVPCQEHLGVALDGREAVGVPAFFGVSVSLLRLLLTKNETPNLVGLHVLGWNPLHDLLKESLAFIASFNHRGQDRVAVDVGKPLCGPDRVAFQNEPKGQDRLGHGEPSPIRGASAFVRKRPLARIAPIALRTIPIPTESPHFAFAQWAFHFEPPFFFGAARLE